MPRLVLAAPALALALGSFAACKKEAPPSGLPPAKDWSAGGQQPQQPQQPAPPPAAAPGGSNPHAGMDMSNPHAGMGMSVSPGGPAGANPHGNMGDPAAGPVAQKTQPRTLEKLPGGKLGLGPLAVAVPADWIEKPITSSMRAAQFQLPAPSGEGELVVYYFGEGGAGDAAANIDRWVGQFQQPDGKPSKDVAKVEKTKIGGQEATIVSVSGRYVTTAMPGGGDAIDKSDQSLLAAIVGSSQGPYYFKLVGPKKTIDAHAAKFRAMLASIQPR